MSAGNRQEGMQISDYGAVIRRRKGWLLWPFALALVIGTLISGIMPPVYRATATVKVERAEIPSSVVASTVVGGFVDEQIENLSRRVLSGESLYQIAVKYNLYPEISRSEARGVLVGRVRENIHREPVSVEVTNPSSGRATVSTIAFTISYDSEDPATAQAVANELAKNYVRESERMATRQAGEVANFLSAESARLAERVSHFEQKLADFKRKHASELPELAELNRSQVETIQAELDRLVEALRALEEQRILLSAQLAQTERHAPLAAAGGEALMSPNQRLNMLKNEYLQGSARYAPDHPDLVRIRSEIEILSGQIPGGSELSRLVQAYENVRLQLVTARQRYSELHPDVQRLSRRLDELKGRIATGVVLSGEEQGPTDAVPATNPAYLSLQARLDSVVANLNMEIARKESLEQRLATYQKRLTSAPAVEREYLSLRRDHEDAVNKYQEIRDKETQARLAEQLESERKGDHFALAEEASVPTAPVKPNKIGILAVAAFLGMVGGIGGASVAEYRDTSIHDGRDLAGLTGALPLAAIPTIRSEAETRSEGLPKGLIAVAAVALLLLASHVWWQPIDVTVAQATQWLTGR